MSRVFTLKKNRVVPLRPNRTEIAMAVSTLGGLRFDSSILLAEMLILTNNFELKKCDYKLAEISEDEMLKAHNLLTSNGFSFEIKG